MTVMCGLAPFLTVFVSNHSRSAAQQQELLVSLLLLKTVSSLLVVVLLVVIILAVSGFNKLTLHVEPMWIGNWMPKLAHRSQSKKAQDRRQESEWFLCSCC